MRWLERGLLIKSDQMSGWWAKGAQVGRSPLGETWGRILWRLLMMDFRVVRCGLPRDLVVGYQAVRMFWVGESGLSLISFPTNVSCRFSI